MSIYVFFTLFLLLLILPATASISSVVEVPKGRPAYANRTFHSEAVDAYLEKISAEFQDPSLATLFSNTLPNTLDTTVYDPDTGYIITGDVAAMWLRDACNQVQPYLPFLSLDSALDTLMVNIVNRMASSVLLNPFANAFNPNSSLPGEHADDNTTPPMTNAVFENKYELDSLAAFLKLSRGVYANSPTLFRNTSSSLSSSSSYANWLDAVNLTTTTIRNQQMSTAEEMAAAGQVYTFQRFTDVATDTLMQSKYDANYRNQPHLPNDALFATNSAMFFDLSTRWQRRSSRSHGDVEEFVPGI